MRFCFNNKGITLVENIVAFAILGAVLLVVVNGISFIDNEKKVQAESYSGETIVLSLIESIRANIHLEKINPAPDPFINARTIRDLKNQLHLCWTRDGYFPRNNQDCPGRMGYSISTLTTGAAVYRGLYKVTLRVTHDTLFPNRFKNYEFIVRDP